MRLFVSASFVVLLAAEALGASSVLQSRSHHAHLAHRANNRRAPTKRCPAKADNGAKNHAVTPPPSTSLGLIKSDYFCNGKPSGAKPQITLTGGPNGDQSWLNCGIDTPKGWQPAPVHVDDIVALDLDEALKDPDSPYHACGPYISIFKKYAKLNGLPPIMLTAFSMQESGCKPNTVGGGGEQGMMQITSEKCVGAPHGNCKDPDFNIKTAAAFFGRTLKGFDGHILEAVGTYNGWHRNMTFKQATAARYTHCCRCQNNLDYLMQFFNGWLLNVSPYKRKLGHIFNLDVCPKVVQPN